MEAKKSIKIISLVAMAAIVIFLLVIFLNRHSDSQQTAATTAPLTVGNSITKEGRQSYAAANLPTINEADFVSGNNKEALNIIIYEDYTDNFCADLASSSARARLDFGDKINFAYRPFNANNSSLSEQAAIAVRCAAVGGKGEQFRDKIFASVRANQFKPENFLVFAGEVGLNKDDFQTCLTNPEKKEKIEELVAQANNFSVYGAPTIFVGDEMIVGARPYESYIDSNGDQIEGLKQVIERQLK